MGFGPEGLGPPALLRQLEARIGPQAPLQLQALMDQGLSARDAFAQLSQAAGFSPNPGQGPSGYPQGPGFDAGPPGRLEPSAVGQIFDSLPPDVQQAIVRGADQLPQPVRDALDQLGITQPQVQPQGRGDGPQAAQAAGVPAENTAAQQAGGAAQAPGESREAVLNFARAESLAMAQLPGATRADAVPMAANAAIVREGAQQATPGGQLSAGAAADRSVQQGLPAPAGGRAAEGFVGVARDPGTVVAMPERMANLQQATQAPNATPQLVRADTVPMQALASLAGATVLANPQAPQMPGHVGLAAPAPPGTDAAAAQARDAQLAPAGHTLAGFLRRDLRRGATPQDRRPENWALALLAGNRKRRVDEAEEQATSFQWLFWILTVVAYGSIGFALIALIPGQPGLTTGSGQLTGGGYALVLGALATVTSWLVGKRIARGDGSGD